MSSRKKSIYYYIWVKLPVIKQLYSNYTDTELLAFWHQGHEKAFNAIYERHFIRLLNIAHKKTGSMEIAEELVQDVFMSFYRQRDLLHADTVPGNYLFIALKNRIFNHHRQLLSQLKKEQALRVAFVESREVNQALEFKELQSYVKEQVEALPPQCRTVFLLSREAQLSNKEVAARLNISVNTVEQHMRKALRLLKDGLGKDVAWVLVVAFQLM